jgi:possible relaxase
MEDKRLTLENVEEIGLELLKEENGNSDEISLYYNYDEEITKETMEEVREIKKANEYETLYDAFKNYLSEVNFDYIDDLKDELVKRTIENNSDYPYESEEYQELFDKAVEIVEGNFSINVNTNDILKNTRVRDVAVILSPNDNENFYLSNFNISEEFRDDVPQDSPMFFLIQSQGYEVEDLYDDEKVENSPFLKSLSKEVKGFWEEVKIGFYTNMNLRDLIDLEESNENIVIPKFIESDLVLEKEIVISRDKVKIYSDYSEEQEESNYTIGGFVREEIINTNEKAFEIHEVDKEKIYKIINFLEEKELQEEELEKTEIRDNLYPPKDEEKFNKDKKEMQGELLNYLEEKGYIEKEKEEYKFKKDVLEKDNFESYADDFLSQSLEFKNDVFTKNFSAKNLVERFDLKLPDFKIYNNENGEMIYNSETREKAKDLEEFIIDKKGEEFWNNMNFSKLHNWESLIDDNSVTILSKTDKIYNDYSKFVFEEMDKKEFSSNVYEENIVYLENVRIDLVENSKENKMSKENYEKIKEKYLGTENKEIETKEVTKDDREIEM